MMAVRAMCRVRIGKMAFARRAMFTMIIVAHPALLISQSIYTLETLPADQFEPSVGFDRIVGLHIDLQGNIAGWAEKGVTSKLGFYWPSNGNPVRKLILATPSYPGGCEPRGVDAEGLVYLYCKGSDRRVTSIYTPLSGNYRELSLPDGKVFEVQGAGGKSWSVGYSLNGGHFAGVRRKANGSIEALPSLPLDVGSIAVGVNSKGAATGLSSSLSFLIEGLAGDAAAPWPGRAVLWAEGNGDVQAIPLPNKLPWIPKIGRAINDDLVVIGSTSPLAPLSACSPSSATRDQTGTFGFVSTLRTGGDRVTEFLPLVPGDTTATTMTPSGVNIHGAIVGTRDGTDCGSGSVLDGRRAILWKSRVGVWVANVLDRYPISLDTGICARDLILTEARAINDAGQITGAGYCADSEGTRRSIAYRLTPTGVDEP